MPFHAFFDTATMTMSTAMSEQFCRFVDLRGCRVSKAINIAAGRIAWGSNELPVIVAVVRSTVGGPR